MSHLRHNILFMITTCIILCTGCSADHISDQQIGLPGADGSGTEASDGGTDPAVPMVEDNKETPNRNEIDIEATESGQPDIGIGEDESIELEETKRGEETDMGIQPVFTVSELNDEVRTRITGCSYPQDDSDIPVKYDDLRYLTVTYVDFEGRDQRGEIICNQVIAQDLIEIFQELYAQRYPIEKVRLVDEYGADDERSMADNNSSSFNYRVIYGTKKISKHGLGMAIDINPLYNPYITSVTGSEEVQPAGAEPYTDREADFPHKIDHEDLCYRLFTEHGFRWGGDWTHTKDYQHFDKS